MSGAPDPRADGTAGERDVRAGAAGDHDRRAAADPARPRPRIIHLTRRRAGEPSPWDTDREHAEPGNEPIQLHDHAAARRARASRGV